MKDVGDGLGVKNVSELVLKEKKRMKKLIKKRN